MKQRKLISQDDVQTAIDQHVTSLVVAKGTIVTALASELARSRGIEIVFGEQELSGPASSVRTVAIGSDHGGFEFKTILIPFLADLGWKVTDVGTDSDASCDYPDYAFAVARTVQSGATRFGIMIDGAGVGSAMACNKLRGIRAACAYNEFVAWNSRAHNDANVLTLGSRTMGIEVCKMMVKKFLQTSFEGGRHEKRTQKIQDIEAHGSSRGSCGC